MPQAQLQKNTSNVIGRTKKVVGLIAGLMTLNSCAGTVNKSTGEEVKGKVSISRVTTCEGAKSKVTVARVTT